SGFSMVSLQQDTARIKPNRLPSPRPATAYGRCRPPLSHTAARTLRVLPPGARGKRSLRTQLFPSPLVGEGCGIRRMQRDEGEAVAPRPLCPLALSLLRRFEPGGFQLGQALGPFLLLWRLL